MKKQSKYPFIPGLLPTLLVLGSIGSLVPVPPVAAQDSPAAEQPTRRTIPAQYVDLAEEYANQKAEALVTAERKNNRNERKRWTKMLREAGNSLDSASDRVDRIQTLLDIASRDDPEIPKLKAEAGARIDRAYEQAKQWADVEEVAVALPEGFANLVTGQLGIKLDFGGSGTSAELVSPRSPTTPTGSAELIPPRADDPGWLASALNSDEAKGAGGTGALVLLLLAIQRMRRKDQEEGDKRNDQTTEKAAERAIDRVLQKREAQYAGQGGAGNQGR